MNLRIRLAIGCALLGFTSACGDKSEAKFPVQDTSSAPVATQPAVVDQECPATGLWAVCSVEKRLKQSGFVAQRNDSALIERAGFTVQPAVYTLNRSRLELYIYPDAAALGREVLKIDTLKVAPVFIRTGNLAALLFTDDATQAERLSLALTAGAPGAR